MKQKCKPYQKAIAKFAYAVGAHQPLRSWKWERVREVLVHYLNCNEKLVLKYLKMGWSAYETKRRKEGREEYKKWF